MLRDDIREPLGELADIVREQLRIDRLAIEPAAPEKLHQTRVRAWWTIVVLYVLGWGQGVYNAIATLLGYQDHTSAQLGPETVFRQTIYLMLDVALLGLGIAALLYFRRLVRPPSPVAPVAPRTRMRTYFVATVATAIGFLLMGTAMDFGVPGQGYPFPQVEGVAANTLLVISSMMAGPLEEVILLALVVVALRRSAYGWGTVCTVAVLLRVPFHLYYGWGALALSGWALLVVALYRRTAALSAIVLEHATWNLSSSPLVPDVIGVSFKLAVLTVGLVIVQRTFLRYETAGRNRTTDTAPTAAEKEAQR